MVPRQVAPGSYHLLAQLYESDDQTQILRPSYESADQPVVLGQVTVTKRTRR